MYSAPGYIYTVSLMFLSRDPAKQPSHATSPRPALTSLTFGTPHYYAGQTAVPTNQISLQPSICAVAPAHSLSLILHAALFFASSFLTPPPPNAHSQLYQALMITFGFDLFTSPRSSLHPRTNHTITSSRPSRPLGCKEGVRPPPKTLGT
jgi:hypothetical protein